MRRSGRVTLFHVHVTCLAIWALESCFGGAVKADEVSDRSLYGVMSREIGEVVVIQAAVKILG